MATNYSEAKAFLINYDEPDIDNIKITSIVNQNHIFIIKPIKILSSIIKGTIISYNDKEWINYFQKNKNVYIYIEGAQIYKIVTYYGNDNYIEMKQYKSRDILTNLKKSFIIMSMTPSNEELHDIKNTIKESYSKVANKYNIFEFSCERIDDFKGLTFSITDKIINQIEKSGIIYCDLTEQKQNCYFELAWALSKKRNVIITAKKGTEIHFDVQNYKINFWKNQTELKKIIEENTEIIIKRVKIISDK